MCICTMIENAKWMKEKYDQDFQGTLNYNVNYILQITTIYLHARTEKRKKNPANIYVSTKFP